MVCKRISRGAVKCLVLLLTFLFLFSSFSFASSNITKTYDLKGAYKDITDKEYLLEKYKASDDGEYIAKDVKIISSKENTISKKYSLENKEQIPKEIKEGNKVYKLDGVKEIKTDKLTFTDVYSDYTSKPDVPSEKTFTKDGKEYIGVLKSLDENISSNYDTAFSVPAKFYGDEDTFYYDLKGVMVSSEHAPTFLGYEGAVLNYLDLDPYMYSINSGVWSSGYYDENGQTVRNATFSGMRKSISYTAVYESKLNDYEAVYKDSKGEGEAKVEITYEKLPLSLMTKLIIASVVFLAVALACILFVILRKRKKENEQD